LQSLSILHPKERSSRYYFFFIYLQRYVLRTS
jgi:hypothetical protein